MPDLEGGLSDQLEERQGTSAEVLIWFIARNRDTGADESIGFWTGDDHQQFSIGGETRLYFGAGAVIKIPPVKAGIGLTVRQHRIVLPPVIDEVQQLLRVYEARLAPVEVHVCTFDVYTNNLLGQPIRMIKGFLNEAPEERGAKDEESRLELTVTSTARLLTFGLPLLRSNEELQKRNPDDKGREYSDVSGDWVVPWGQNSA